MAAQPMEAGDPLFRLCGWQLEPYPKERFIAFMPLYMENADQSPHQAEADRRG